jgi:hypothetical protein
MQRKRKVSHHLFSPPFRAEFYKKHHLTNHQQEWNSYLMTDHEGKASYFDKKTGLSCLSGFLTDDWQTVTFPSI